jgi:hypothetical protein
MSFDTAFLSMMPDTLTVTHLSGVSTDGYGRATYTTSPHSCRCLVQEKQTKVQTYEGTEELATTVVWVRSTTTFGPSDRITLPDGTVPVLMAVEELHDADGVHHHKLFMGRS